MKTAKQILEETRARYAALFADERQCYDLKADELETGSALAALASAAGYDHLRGYLNSGHAWRETVGTVARWLVEPAAMLAAEAQNVGTWDDLDSFLAAAK